jgi:hypothetical protein
MDGLRRFGRGPRRRRKRRVHLRYPQQVHRLRSAGIRVLRGRFEEFLGPDVVLMWLHLAHSGLCGAALLGNCSVELVDNARAIGRDDRDMTDLTVPPLGPDPDDPEDQHLALITALVKIFAADRDDKDR